MKKLPPLLLVLLMASSVLAQEQNKANTTALDHPASNPVVDGRLLTDAHNGKTITLHVGEELGVDLPNERHYLSGDEHYGLEVVSKVHFDGLSHNGVLNVKTFDLGDGSTLQNDRSFVAAAIGGVTLSYKRITSYVGHGGCATPLCIKVERISFNIIVK